MPKAPMTREEVDITREHILDTALDMIIEEGFNNLSTRKIASKMGVSATTIYNYYTNKDELNLMIRVRGFEKLHDLLTERSGPHTDMEARLKAMVRGYVEFGLTYPSYYDIMFNLHTPKYLDYVGTDMEPVAYNEKQNALKCLALFIEPLSAYIPVKGKRKDQFVLYQVVKFWSDLHGLVTLCNSRLFHEVLDDVDAFIGRRTTDLIENIIRMKQDIDEGESLF
jgi:AcrR family transcriptional regulator